MELAATDDDVVVSISIECHSTLLAPSSSPSSFRDQISGDTFNINTRVIANTPLTHGSIFLR